MTANCVIIKLMINNNTINKKLGFCHCSCFAIYELSGIDWRIHADFEQASRRIVRRAARYRWMSLRDYLEKSCGIAATATIHRATAVVRSSAFCIRTMPGTPIPDAVPANPNNSRSSLMSSAGITADLCQVAVGAASKVRAAPTANVSITKSISIRFSFSFGEIAGNATMRQ